jgi:hypothetical protein
MKKETVFAILLGIGAGVLIALWVIKTTHTSIKDTKQLVNDEKITPSISNTTEVTEPLLISEPQDGFVTSKNTITIKGTAKKDTLLVVQSPKQETTDLLSSNEFSSEVSLFEGLNAIRITSYNKGVVESQLVTIYYVSQ